jgi:hypothetical protein
LSFHSDAIEAGRESTAPCFSAKRPGPQGTIAKEIGERKEKRKKSGENGRFLGGVWKSPLNTRVKRRLTPLCAANGAHGMISSAKAALDGYAKNRCAQLSRL